MGILVKRVSKGDRKAYAALFHEFYTPLLLYSKKFTKNREVSEDIVQDFFCRLWEDRKRLVNDKSFHAYMYSAVRNRSLNYLRDFLREMMEEEVYRELYAAIQKLPERCRRIFLLKLDGEENQKIADMLQISEETVRSQLRRGKELLQNNVVSFYVLGVICYWCDF